MSVSSVNRTALLYYSNFSAQDIFAKLSTCVHDPYLNLPLNIFILNVISLLKVFSVLTQKFSNLF